MKPRIVLSFACVITLFVTMVLASNTAIAQQTAQAHHRYFVSAQLTIEGMKNLQKQTATGLRASVAQFAESVGCELEAWYFEPGESTARAFIDCSGDIGAAALLVTANAAGFAHVTSSPVLSAEEIDRAIAISATTRPPQQQ